MTAPDYVFGLTKLPNIGKQTAALLEAAGIATPAELRRVGSVDAAVRMAAVRPDDPPCRSMLSGLEGAIRGVRWHVIPQHQREALWREYQLRLAAQARQAGESPG